MYYNKFMRSWCGQHRTITNWLLHKTARTSHLTSPTCLQSATPRHNHNNQPYCIITVTTSGAYYIPKFQVGVSHSPDPSPRLAFFSSQIFFHSFAASLEDPLGRSGDQIMSGLSK